MPSDVLTSFSCLDELTQVIYQSIYRFVVISTVSDIWTVHVGLAGPEGRWWRGIWHKADILHLVGSKPSDTLLEAFADKLMESFVQGQLFIGDWSPDKEAKIKLIFDPSSKKPLYMSLDEISSADAASYATNVFLEIALRAQSRKCRLHPDQIATYSISAPSSAGRDTATVKSIAPRLNVKESTEVQSLSTVAEKKAQEEIKVLKAELDRQKHRVTPPASVPEPVHTPLKGASLANPNKRARKYQEIEFESDEE